MRVLAAIAVLLGSTAAQAGSAAVDREQMQEQLATLAQQISLAQRQIEQSPGARVQLASALQQLSIAQAQVGELLRQISIAPPASARPGGPPTPQATYLSPIGDATLRALIQQIATTDFASDKVNVMRQAASGNFFLVDQVARVLPLYVHSSDRVTVLALLAGQILDRANNFKLLGAFQFAGDRERARLVLEAAPPLPAR